MNARSDFFFALTESAPKRQIIGNLQQPAYHQRRRQPAGCKHRATQRWTNCRSKTARYGSEAGGGRALGRRNDSHDEGAPRRDIHLREQRTYEQQADGQLNIWCRSGQDQAEIGRNMGKHHGVEQANARGDPGRGQL